MITSDTLHIISPTLDTTDTVCIPQYIMRNPNALFESNDSSVSCLQSVVTAIHDSASAQKERKTLFADKTYCPANLQTEINNGHSVTYDWLFGFFVILILLTAVLKRFVGSVIWSFLQSCFSINQLNIVTKNGETTHGLAILPVVFIFLPLLSLLLFYACMYWNVYPTDLLNNISFPADANIILIVGIYISLVVLYFFKLLMIKFISWIFGSKKIPNYYIQMQLNFGNLTAFSLILPIFCLFYIEKYYAEIFIFINFLIIILLYITRLCRSFYVIIRNNKFSHVYLFFYLCILELVPILFLGKQVLFK